MFETAELGQYVTKEEYAEREPLLRAQLLNAQADLRSADFPVILLFSGVDGAGKGELANLLQAWLDPRGIVTRAFGPPSEEEKERPLYWRFWRDLPPKGHIGIFLSAWYSGPLLDRVKKRITDAELDDQLDNIVTFEKTLADDGALVLKFWMHLGKQQQKARFEALEKDPHQSWRVTKKDWGHWKLYRKFVAASERIIMRTSTGEAPWIIVEGTDARFRSLEVGTRLLDAMRRHIADREARRATKAQVHSMVNGGDDYEVIGTLLEEKPTKTVLDVLDTSTSLTKDYKGSSSGCRPTSTCSTDGSESTKSPSYSCSKAGTPLEREVRFEG